MEKMIQIAESYGWADRYGRDSIEFNQCSPAGEDFSFTVLTKDASDAESLAAEVRSYADSFDTGTRQDVGRCAGQREWCARHRDVGGRR